MPLSLQATEMHGADWCEAAGQSEPGALHSQEGFLESSDRLHNSTSRALCKILNKHTFTSTLHTFSTFLWAVLLGGLSQLDWRTCWRRGQTHFSVAMGLGWYLFFWNCTCLVRTILQTSACSRRWYKMQMMLGPRRLLAWPENGTSRWSDRPCGTKRIHSIRESTSETSRGLLWLLEWLGVGNFLRVHCTFLVMHGNCCKKEVMSWLPLCSHWQVHFAWDWRQHRKSWSRPSHHDDQTKIRTILSISCTLSYIYIYTQR